MRLSTSLVLSFVFTAASSSVAHAAPPSESAEVLFTQGKDAMAHGDLVTGCAKLSESLKLDPAAVGTLLNLATCEERSGKLTAALDHFTTARMQLPKDDFRIGFTNEQIAGLTPRVAHLTVRVPEARKSEIARVLRDGAELPTASWNMSIAIDPGKHVIVVESNDGRRPESRTEIALREGETRILDVNGALDRASAPTRAAELPASAAPPSNSNTAAYVATGIGAIGLVTGTITGLMAINAASTYRDHCREGQCDADGLSAASTGSTTQIVSPIAFAIGVLGIGVGTFLFLSAPASKKTTTTAIMPTASPRGAGLTLMHAF